jgi:hypothetical protein
MKALNILVTLATLIIGFSSPVKEENASLTFVKGNAIEILSNQEFGCRPISNTYFYVETDLVKKSRGFTTINAKVYALDKVSGNTVLLAKQNLIVSNYKDAVLNYDNSSVNFDKTTLDNGDKLLKSETNSLYEFSDLIKFEVINNCYTKSKNKLLKK